MFHDELKQPLQKRSLAKRVWARRPGILFFAYVMAFGGLAALTGWATKQPMPMAGEPMVVLAIPPVEVIAETPAAADKIETASTSEPNIESTPPATEEIIDAAATDLSTAEAQIGDNETPDAQNQGVIIEAPQASDTYQRDAAVIISPRRPLTPAPQPSLTEASTWGPLPRISPSGDKPSRIYARTTPRNVIHSDSPKIALLLGGMGLNKKLTQRAIKELPADVTLGFAPYGENLQAQVDKARSEGHEVLLQVPLEPVGFPATNPGPKTLAGDATSAENIEALRWHMSRFSGYAGVMNYMGSRFLAMPAALKPVLVELHQRGLFFIEDGSLALSASEDAARLARADARRARIVIDANPTPEAIQAALTTLEEQATGTGFALGTGTGLDVTIETVREWAKAAAERGIVLVPVSAAFQGRTG